MGHGFEEKDTMFSVGERPWHGLGTVLKSAPTIQEAIVTAGLDWDVELQPLQTITQIDLEGHRGVIRTDDNSCLGVVSSGYKVLQNKDAFKFFEPFVEEELATLETAGSLFNGKRVFILAKLNSENMVIDDNDTVEKYILLSNSHDGSQAVRVGFTPIRVVCNNTLTFAETSNKSQLIKIHHSGNVTQTLKEVIKTFDLVNQQFLATEEQYKYLATLPVNSEDLKNYVRVVFSTKKLEEQIANNDKEAIENFRKKLLNTVEAQFEKEDKKNAWTMYNSVNWYFNHEKGRSLETRYNSLWFADSKRIDKKAFEAAMKQDYRKLSKV